MDLKRLVDLHEAHAQKLIVSYSIQLYAITCNYSYI